MLIVYDRISKKIINNFGTNSLFPEGNISIELNENEKVLKFHDVYDKEKVDSILKAKDVKIIEDDNGIAIDFIVLKTWNEHLELEKKINYTVIENKPTNYEIMFAEYILDASYKIKQLENKITILGGK